MEAGPLYDTGRPPRGAGAGDRVQNPRHAWKHAGDDDKVVRPVIRALARLPEEEISSFQDILAQELFALDDREWARESGPCVVGRA
jgi:hypothetical protein